MPQKHFYLPELESNIPVPKENAHWFNNERKIILGISDGILIDEQSMARGVSSIPDIWARPLLFQSAIKTNSKHPLKNKCIQEWRGLISLLALHKVKPELSGLEIVAVNLDAETFSTALRNLAPRPVQLEKTKTYAWTKVLLIKFNGIALGAFSPTTLVYTGVDYNRRLKQEHIALMDDEGFLAPPQTREEGLEHLGEWLYHFQKKLHPVFDTGQQNPDHGITGMINELIDDWLKEIRQKLSLRENEPIDVRTYKVSEDAIEIAGLVPDIEEHRVYELLLHPLRKDETVKDDSLVSDILLRSTRKKELRVVVVTEKILSSQVNLWGELRPKSLGDNPRQIVERFFDKASGTRINNVNIGEANGLWVRPEKYFLSNTLLRAKSGNILHDDESELNLGARYILPFKKEILDFFSIKDIKEKLNPVYKEDGGVVKFSFTLPVGDTSYKIERAYKTKVSHDDDGEILEAEVPVLEMFPNYLGENWRRYYLFQGMAENYKVQPVVAAGTVIKSRQREYKDQDLTQQVRITEISGDNCFPEALEVRDNKENTIGLILLEKTGRIQGLNNSWTVGIDFGTSNTNVYKNMGSADTAERWCYNFPEYYRSITQSEGKFRDRVLEEYFFPTRKISLPIPTTLKIYDQSKKESMLLDYFIYHPIAYKFPANVLSDIKWDGGGERKTEYFLESLLFLLLIEVVRESVNEVQLACSYPKAFSPTNIEVFQREWENVFEKLLRYEPGKESEHASRILNIHRDITADNELKIRIRKPIFKTEGIAAGEYFASPLTIKDITQRANKEIAAICLDVGGGTTDISIWYHNNIEFDASVLLAGRQLANILQTNNRVRELLFSREAAVALEEKKHEPGYFSARLNLVLKNEEERVQEMLVRHANNRDIQWLRQIIALEFGALSFYAAQVCVSTNEKVGGLLSRISNDGINLHWGGNAAKLINWIDFGKYNREGIASKILNATFFKCLDDKSLAEKAIKPKKLEQLQSPGHKSEASGGLVVMDLHTNAHVNGIISGANANEFDMPEDEDDAQHFYAGIVCGENIEVGGKIIPFYTPISNKDLFDEKNRSKFTATTLDRLTRFVEVLNFFGIKNGLFTEDTRIILGETEKRIIRDNVFGEFIKMQSLRESQRLIEPVFIMEIKFLLELIKSKMN